MTSRTLTLRVVSLALIGIGCFAQTPVPQATPLTVQQILARMIANVTGIKTYQVPVRIDARIHKVITLPVSMSGTRYFKLPDKEALKMRTVPSLAKPFQNAYAALGTPATWSQTYDIAEVTPTLSNVRPLYELRGVLKKRSNVDHILLDVDATTFEPVQARWYYVNGATIVMNIEEHVVGGKYHLPARETLDVSFPSYRGSAVVQYGEYTINQEIPDSVFAQK